MRILFPKADRRGTCLELRISLVRFIALNQLLKLNCKDLLREIRDIVFFFNIYRYFKLLYEFTSVCIMPSGKAFSSCKLAYILTCFRNTFSVKIRASAYEVLTLVQSRFFFYSLKLMNCTVFFLANIRFLNVSNLSLRF